MDTLLIVDDHEGFRNTVAQMLHGDVFSVVGAIADGESAVDAIKEHRPDLVLLDVQLPGIGGFAVAERIAALATPPPVILTSTRDADDFGSRLQNAHVIGFLPKQDMSVVSVSRLLTRFRDGLAPETGPR